MPGWSALAVLTKNIQKHHQRLVNNAARRSERKEDPPPHPVDVRLHSQGEIKVEDVGDVLEVDPSGDPELFVL